MPPAAIGVVPQVQSGAPETEVKVMPAGTVSVTVIAFAPVKAGPTFVPVSVKVSAV